MTSNAFHLHSVSTVITAEFHNPSIMNPDFLKANKIVPSGWKARETMTTLPLATTTYTNGIRITVEPDKLQVLESCAGEFKDTYAGHGIAAKYVAKLPHVPYRSVGMNCQLTMQKAKPDYWLMRRFLKSGKWTQRTPKVLNSTIKLTLDAGPEAVCNLTLSPGQVQSSGQDERPVVFIDCNIHHEGPVTAREIKSILSSWPERQQYLQKVLEKILKGTLS